MSAQTRGFANASHADGPHLRGLGPKYEEGLHGRHAAALLNVLSDDPESTAKNIAISGHYGSGKSSVILGVQAGLDSRKVRWVNLSLSSLGIDDTRRARIQADGTLAPLTNLIQKEIVKQLLYRKSPAAMPRSRYLRIDSFRPGPAAMWGAVVAVAFFVIAVLLGLVSRVEEVVPATLSASSEWAPWAVVGAMSLFVGGVWFLSLRERQSKLRLESFSAGGAAVKLSAKENSYFDEYLDEIVYFFERTKTQVAIFEDLDRFKDPHIFETLRELNTILNNSEQIECQPIRFVYAVRDSIFEQLEVDASLDAGRDGAARRASALETVPSANRTKFFDLVIPMVPFITHRSARDLLAAEFAESDERPSEALMDLVGAHLTDMRLIRNIRNEFEIYRASVLGENGLKGLTADRLFAMMVYKNLHLEDFEAIRLGTSKIDEAYGAFRDMVTHQTSLQTARSKAALDRIDAHALWEQRAEAAGERLQSVLPILHKAASRGGNPTLRYQGRDYALAELTSGDLWRSMLETRAAVEVLRSGLAALSLSFAELIALVGEDAASMEEAVKADVSRLEQASRLALDTKSLVGKATMAELMARPDLVMPADDGTQHNLKDRVAELVSDLARELLADGYIDENFTLYCSDYHDVAISVTAMNFILHCVQPNRSDYLFHFDGPESIVAVEKEMGSRFLDGASVFNIEVFDHYLGEAPQRLKKALDVLVASAPTDSSFIDAYLVDGQSKDLLVAELTSRWKGILVHLVEKAPVDGATRVSLVDAAIGSAREVDYVTSEPVLEFISEHYRDMSTFTGSVEPSVAAAVVGLSDSLGAEFSDLAVLGVEQRKAVISRGLYPVTRANVSIALGASSGLELDVVKEADLHVYERILQDMDDYLSFLEGDEVTVDASSEFVRVLRDVADRAQSALLPVAERASERCEVADLDNLSEVAWPAVVSAGRFAPTVTNVARFVEEIGVTEDLVDCLQALELTDIEATEAEVRLDLAYALVDSEVLDPDATVRFLQQLELPDKLDVEQLSEAGVELIPALLASDLVPDTAESYSRLSDRTFVFRERYFAASKDLPTYVRQLPLSSDDLTQVMRSRRVAPAAKRAIADDATFVTERLSREGAIAVCQWADMGNIVSVELLAGLAEAGAPAERVLSLLKDHLSDIQVSVLDRILCALGDEYEPLTRLGHHRPKLKDRPGTTDLLEELKRRDRVSSFRPTMMGSIRVNMRR